MCLRPVVKSCAWSWLHWLRPSRFELEGARPAMARMVGNQSVTWSHRLLTCPAGTRPGLWIMAGVRVPPSNSKPCHSQCRD